MNLNQIKQETREEFAKHIKKGKGVFLPTVYEVDRNFLDSFADRLVDEVEKAVVADLKKNGRGGLCRISVKSAFTRFKGESV